MSEAQLREEICEVGRLLWHRQILVAKEGNLSVRIDENRILSTPPGLCKGRLIPEQLVVIDNNGKSLQGGEPSTEIKMHLRMYQRRPDCIAIVHAHPAAATGFATGGHTIPDNAVPEADAVLGRVALVPFGTPGTDEVPNAMEPYIGNHKTFLLSNHGAVVIGSNLEDAYFRMETLERVAQIVLNAMVLGGIRRMPV